MVNGISAEELQMKELMEGAGIPWGQLTPAQQYGQYATAQFRPGPGGLRSAFWDVREPLLQQYYLQQPSMANFGGFADFMGSGALAQQAGGFGLREQAEQAAFMARMPGAQFYQYVDPQEGYTGPAITDVSQQYFDAMSEAQQLMYRQTYGTAGEGVAAANQAQLANLLALQRPGGGMYGGPMGQAITGALGELRGQFLGRNPEANFLDWYLSRTEGGQGLGGFLTGAATT